MTYKPGDKKLVEAEIISVLKTSPAYAPCYKCDVDGREVLVRKEFIHPAPEYKNGEDVEILNGNWIKNRKYIGPDPTREGHHVVIENTTCAKPISLRGENIRRPQKKYTVELTEERVQFAKDFVKDKNRLIVSQDVIEKYLIDIAEQCHD